MNLSFITRAVGAVKLASKAHAPTIMVTAGIVSMGASVVVASNKTLYVDSILKQHVADLEKIEQGTNLGLSGYTKDVALKDRGRVYGRASVDLARHYFVPGVLFFGGAALVFGGHRIMLKRNATLALAYTGLAKAFEAYRERVRENMGSEFDQGMMSGFVKKEIYDDESGKSEMVNTRDWDGNSNSHPYSRIFEQGETDQWTNDLGVNTMFIQNQQRFAQELLNRRKYLYLFEVLEALGFTANDVSRVVGWKATKHPDGSWDFPVVDFGLNNPHPDDWKFGRDAAVYLEFNCHGLIVGGKIQKILESST